MKFGRYQRRILVIVMAVLCAYGGLSGCGREGKVRSANRGSTQAQSISGSCYIPEGIMRDILTAVEHARIIFEEKKAQEEQIAANLGIIIALDPGHQAPYVDMSAMEPNAPGSSQMKRKATGGTSGVASGIGEYQLNLDIALMVRDELVKLGYQVVMTREDNDTAISNAERATLANESGASISVRIHANGSENPGASGALALVPSSSNAYVGHLSETSYALAECVLGSYCEATGFPNIGIQSNDSMTGINWSEIPVMILEMGFMSNPDDDRRMADPEFRIQMAQGITNGIVRFFNR